MIHGRDSAAERMQVAQVVRKARAPWPEANVYGVFVHMHALWWTLTAGGLVSIISPVSTLVAESPSPPKSSRLILILTTCVTCRTHVCYPFICEMFLGHPLADYPLLKMAFNHVIVRLKYYLTNVDCLNFQGEKVQAVPTPAVLVKMDLLCLI